MKPARFPTALLLLAMALAGCSSTRNASEAPGTAGYYKVGKPYRIKGRWYRPEYDPSYDRVGVASWYGQDFHGLPTANGEVFDKDEITAAHPTLPLPSVVRVTNLENGRSLTLRVNDRGPFVGDRLIDLSQAAARKLGYEGQGLAHVRVQFLELADDARGARPTPTIARRTASAPVTRVAEARPRLLPAASPPQPIKVAALATPAAASKPAAWCSIGPQFVQIGAFAETDTVRAAMDEVGDLSRVQVEPAFIGDRAVVRVRLGPVADALQAQALLRQVRALGYDSAFVTPAGADAKASC